MSNVVSGRGTAAGSSACACSCKACRSDAPRRRFSANVALKRWGRWCIIPTVGSIPRHSLLRAPRRRRSGHLGRLQRRSYDNVLAETVNGLYKTELIHRRGPWRTLDHLEVETAKWVDWWNNRRLHGFCGDIPPAEYEENYYRAIEEATAAA